MSLKFYFIRHGQSQSNLNPEIIAGSGDSAQLSSLGEDQASNLGQYFSEKNLKIDYIYSSNLVRASHTASIFADQIGYAKNKIVIAPEISELKQGNFEGRKREEIYTPENIAKINTAGYLFRPPNGESQRMVERRFSNWLEDEILLNTNYSLESGETTTIAIFGHGIAINCLLHYIMGFNDRLIYRFKIENTGFCEFNYTDEGWFPVSINNTNHLS